MRQTCVSDFRFSKADDSSSNCEGFAMRHTVFSFLVLFVFGLGAALAAEPTQGTVIAKPEAFKTLLGPDCSHCIVEAQRRKAELRADDRVLCWRQVFQDGYTNDGAI